MGGFAWLHWLIVSAMLFLPAVLVMVSPKVRGYEKFAWTCVSLFLSWVGFVIFLVVHMNRTAPSNTR